MTTTEKEGWATYVLINCIQMSLDIPFKWQKAFICIDFLDINCTHKAGCNVLVYLTGFKFYVAVSFF